MGLLAYYSTMWQAVGSSSWVGRCAVGIDLGRVWTALERVGEEQAGGRQIPLLRYQHIDDLPILVDRPIQIRPPPGDFHIRLVYEPAISRGMPARASRVDQQWGEPVHPSIDRDMIDSDAPLGQQLFHVTVGKPGAGRYQRTAKVITSGGNRNLANAEDATEGATQRAALINQA